MKNFIDKVLKSASNKYQIDITVNYYKIMSSLVNWHNRSLFSVDDIASQVISIYNAGEHVILSYWPRTSMCMVYMYWAVCLAPHKAGHYILLLE